MATLLWLADDVIVNVDAVSDFYIVPTTDAFFIEVYLVNNRKYKVDGDDAVTLRAYLEAQREQN